MEAIFQQAKFDEKLDDCTSLRNMLDERRNQRHVQVMCEYCTKFHEKQFNNEDGDSSFMLCWNYSSFKVRKKVWHIVALAEGVGVHSGKINYCPMCGRKLVK
jgi:hypothetical protein